MAPRKVTLPPEDEGVIRPEDRMPVQRCIDGETGRDITKEYVTEGLKRLEIIGLALVETALWMADRHPDQRDQIYEDFRDRLFQVIGQGSLGPATAAAGPLMSRMLRELAQQFGKPE